MIEGTAFSVLTCAEQVPVLTRSMLAVCLADGVHHNVIKFWQFDIDMEILVIEGLIVQLLVKRFETRVSFLS